MSIEILNPVNMFRGFRSKLNRQWLPSVACRASGGQSGSVGGGFDGFQKNPRERGGYPTSEVAS